MTFEADLYYKKLTMFNFLSDHCEKRIHVFLFIIILQCPYGHENVPSGQPKKKFNSAFYV